MSIPTLRVHTYSDTGALASNPARANGSHHTRDGDAKRNNPLPFLHRVAHVKQDLEVQLFAAVGEIELRHRAWLAGFLRAVEPEPVNESETDGLRV